MKAILVIDMPSRCFGCKLHRVIDGENEKEFMVFCCPLRRPVNDLEERPSWCPLKPMPEHEKPQDPDETWEEMHIRMGYNKCLEDITNEP